MYIIRAMFTTGALRATDKFLIMPRLQFLQDSEDNTHESRMWGRVKYCFDSKAK